MKLIFCVKTVEPLIPQWFWGIEKERKLQYQWYHNFRSYVVEVWRFSPPGLPGYAAGLRCPNRPALGGARLASSTAAPRSGSLFLPPAAVALLAQNRRCASFGSCRPQKENQAPKGCLVAELCQWATKKIFSALLNMNSNSCINHGESRVYHQFRRNCISSKRSFVYHHCEKKCSLRLMIYTFGDEMHACA